MATVTNNPRRRLSRVPNAPTYANLASRYADTFQKAIEQQEQNDLNTKLTQFKMGEFSYEDLKKYLEQKIKEAPDGSSKKAQYTSSLYEADKFNKANIESEAKSTVERLRTQMLDSIKGKVTTAKELEIVRELKKAVNPESGAYADLVMEEAKLKNQVANEGAAGGKKGIQDALDKYYAKVSIENENLIKDYQAGKITGYELDTRLFQNGIEFQKAIAQAEKSGANIPTTYYQAAEDTAYVKQRLGQREVGQVFDVMAKNGQVEAVTHQELEADKLRDNPQFIRSQFTIEPGPNGRFQVVDTKTGQVQGRQGESGTIPRTFKTESDAQKFVSNLEQTTGYSVVVPKANENGITTLQQYNYDPKSQSYYTSEAPDKKVYTPVATGFESRFQVQPNKNLGDFINAGVAKLKSYFTPDQTNFDLDKMQADFYPKDQAAGPFIEPTILSAPEVTPTMTPDKPMVTPTPKKSVFGQVKDFFSPPKQPVYAQNQLPNPIGPGNNPGLSNSFGPSFDLPDFKIDTSGIPSGGFNLPNMNFNAPSMSSSASVNGPSMSPGGSSTGFLGSIKNFGQSALGKVKSWLGF